MNAMLDIRDLTLEFETPGGLVHALDRVNLSVERGECVALVGESGSGKSITGMSILRLNGANARIAADQIALDGGDLQGLSDRAFQTVRGRRIAMIFQNAKSALNPLRKVGDTLTDILRAHAPEKLTRRAARARVQEVLEQIGIHQAEDRMLAYPAELSGGMCQRIMIAAALVCEPELIIADEPTSALDVTTQAKVMDLLMSACRTRGVAVLFITHDLALASAYCDRAVVMHAGQMLEDGPADEVFVRPRHPYSRMLLDSMPYGKDAAEELKPMGGNLPDLRRDDLPSCRFADRCPRVQPCCRTAAVPQTALRDDHTVRCFFPHD
ncbi:ABC transporter ATP-binding protein [Pseudodonghicola flavimaris]|uniref:ABC transporter ATP-binding protein n=1 Tax=Pseudodonghicola flavimaris TaxID=3050036 RepID=A0ABT7F5A8_9RHOB|nr:ABC transporter ATP-binding protein [Pseudodonghicola flavimaris]MDK3019787.1 ABC transporter ATP-binding protein [Pseudodonghicola flavimaris]